MSKFAVKNMIQKHYGPIVFITFTMSHLGFKAQTNYAAFKSSQIAMNHYLSKDAAIRGITVNCVFPGFVSFELIDDLSQTRQEEYTNMIPIKKFSTPKQIAYGVILLALKEAA